jgi:carbonic anhydrase
VTTPSEALEILKSGNARFVAGETTHRNLPASVRATAGGQSPFAAIVSCMDSRVPVELVFDLTVGDVFSIRVAGNVVNRDVLGSLEFSTKIAGASLVLVLGHTNCGAIAGAIDNVDLGNLSGTLSKVRPAVAAVGVGSSADRRYTEAVAEENVRNSMREIRRQSAVLTELLDSGAVELAGGIYDVETGRARFLASDERPSSP